MRILGLIPARGGSKGVPGKNILPMNGKPLVQRAFEVAQASTVVERIVLSTDSDEIAGIARQIGLEVPFMRPAQLGSDDAPMIAVMQHALLDLAANGYVPDAVLLLQPTSPLRRPAHLQEAVDLLGNADSVCSVTPIPQELCPHYVMRIDDNRLLPFLPEGAHFTRRQDVPLAYSRDGTVYLSHALVVRAGSVYGNWCVPMLVDPSESISIDSIDDWERAEARLREVE